MSACLQCMISTLGRQHKPILHWFDVAGILFREQAEGPNQIQSNHLTNAQNGRKGTLCSIQLSFTVQGSSKPIQTVTKSPPWTFLSAGSLERLSSIASLLQKFTGSAGEVVAGGGAAFHWRSGWLIPATSGIDIQVIFKGPTKQITGWWFWSSHNSYIQLESSSQKRQNIISYAYILLVYIIMLYTSIIV